MTRWLWRLPRRAAVRERLRTMGARGINIALEAHPIQILAPQNISGGVSAQPFHLKEAAKCNILLAFGAVTAQEGPITLLAGTDSTFATSVPVPFDVYKQENSGTGNDVLAPRLAVPATGFTPAGGANEFYVLHLQADQLPQGYPWLKLQIADGTNTDYGTAFAILTGLRFQGESNPTATV